MTVTNKTDLIPKGWAATTLGELVTFQRGHDLPKSKIVDGPYPIMGSNGIIGYHHKNTTKALGVTIGRSGNIGHAFLIKTDFWAHNTTLYAKQFHASDPTFIYFLVKSLNFNRFNSGSAVPSLNRNFIHPIPLNAPSLPEQKAIAGVLSSLDDKIELLRKQNETLDAIAQTIFKEWFVNFNFPDKNGKPYKDSGGKMIDSELGPIPYDWRVASFGELLDFTIGGDWGEEEADEQHTEKVRIVRGTDIPTLRAGGKDKIPCRFVKSKKLQSRIIQAGDIIIEVSGGSTNQPTGRSVYFTQSMIDRLGGVVEPASFCRLFRPKTLPLGVFAGIHLQILYDDDRAWNYQNQSTNIANFQTTEFLETEQIALPDDNIVTNAFYEIIHPIIEKVNGNSIVTLGIMRDTLLPKLMSGQVRVQL